MNTLNYIGCKQTLCPLITNIINDELEGLNNMSFLDMFSGTGSIGFRFQELTNKCDANDLEYYSFVINSAILKCSYSDSLQTIIDNCNSLEGIDGLIYTHYSENDSCERMFFTSENARKCDAIRCFIEELLHSNQINKNEYYFLLASLIVSMDKVSNTSCVYGAYLKEYKKSALKNMIMTPIHTKTNVNVNINEVFNMKAEELSKKDTYYDVVYMDPPYNQRQYSANYCPLNYIAYYDEQIVLTGKTGLISGYNKSDFCSKSKVYNSFKDILENINCKYIFISYNNEGLLNVDELLDLLNKYGRIKLYKIEYKKFKAQKKVSGDTVYEYLWFIDKTKQPTNIIEEIEYSTN